MANFDADGECMKAKTKKIIIFVVFLLLIALVAVALFNIEAIIGAIGGKNNATDAPGVSCDIDKELNTVYIDGKEYYRKKNVVNYLIMGIDEFGESEERGVGQSDFLMVLSFDVVDKTYTMIPINRDTMTKVQTYDIFGEKTGERVEQIALAHTYGNSFSVSSIDKCNNTAEAVSELLCGVEFRNYVSMTMDAVSVIVDILGGVEVTMSEDWSEIDPAYASGATVMLDGEDAMRFIRARGSLSDSSNIARMRRQNDFLEAFVKKIGMLSMNDEELLEAYDTVSPYLVSSSGADALLEIADKVYSYSNNGTVSLPGEAKVGDRFMEFYVDEKGLVEIVTEIFFDSSYE